MYGLNEEVLFHMRTKAALYTSWIGSSPNWITRDILHVKQC